MPLIINLTGSVWFFLVVGREGEFFLVWVWGEGSRGEKGEGREEREGRTRGRGVWVMCLMMVFFSLLSSSPSWDDGCFCLLNSFLGGAGEDEELALNALKFPTHSAARFNIFFCEGGGGGFLTIKFFFFPLLLCVCVCMCVERVSFTFI